MASRNQNRAPLAAPRSPSAKKENLEEVPLDKRRRIVMGKTMGATANGARSRNVLSAVNSGNNSTAGGDPACNDGGNIAGGIEFSSREDVERLLNEKMKGKNKTDYKGKCEQMMEYIKKLRACIKWYEEREDGLLEDQLKLRGTMEFLEMRSADLAGQAKQNEERFDSELDRMKQNYTTLEETFKQEQADRLSAIDCHKKEMELRHCAEKSRDALSEELRKARHEAVISEQQIKSLRDLNKDLQGYNTNLQQYNSKIQNDAAANAEIISKLHKEKTVMTEALSSSRAYGTLLQEQLSSSKASQQEVLREKEELRNTVEHLRSEIRQIREDHDLQSAKVRSLSSELAKYKECTGKNSIELANLTAKADALEATCSSQREHIRSLQAQLHAANEKLQMADSTALESMLEFDKQKKTISELHNRVSDYEMQISEAEKLRKKLHNTILELKGNIRVFCRVRPMQPDADDSGTYVSYPTTLESVGRGIDLTHNGQKYPFTFDKVFDHDATQEDVFVEISQLVQSALDGYKVCIFAYGQTGSGKTYTMMGKPEAPEQKGLIPRSLEQIFQTSQSLASQGWTYKMQASMLEIYNETIRDLLSSTKSGGTDANIAFGKQCAIKHDLDGNTVVSDLTIVDVCSIKEVSYLLDQAAQSRSVGRTQMNEQSSRSHFVFTLRISGVNESTEQQVQGVLNLIDLAGSERLARSCATGERLKETQSINKSLSALSDVIFSIAKKEDHVPYRNSKLTYLLQSSLGGDSKTLMFVNISPESSSTGESICSLRFAARVNACEIGVPRRQTQTRVADSRLSYG